MGYRFARVRVTPGALIPATLIAATVWLCAPLYDLAGTATSLAWLPDRTSATWVFAAGCALTYFASIIAHEFGHVLAARRYGGRLACVSIGSRIGVRIEGPGFRTNAHQASISFCGPALQALVGLAVFTVAAGIGDPALGTSVGAVLAVVDGVGNLLLPIHRGSDASKFYRSVWRIARGRAAHPFAA